MESIIVWLNAIMGIGWAVSAKDPGDVTTNAHQEHLAGNFFQWNPVFAFLHILITLVYITKNKVKLWKISFENIVDCKTTDGALCVFPYIYKNVKYTACSTIENNGTHWCSTDVDGNGGYNEKWGNCGPECDRP